MDTATLIGLVLGLVGILGGNIMEGGSPTALINIPGFMIVIIGSLGAGITAFPMATVKTMPKLIGRVFKEQPVHTAAVVPLFERMADKARREGLLSLEGSNTDLAQEFTNVILAQRGFQASSRVITASDEMLQDLVNIKR